MMKSKFFILLATMLLVLANEASTQTKTFSLNNSKSSLEIEGTSTLHDWEMDAEKFSCSMNVTLNSGEINNIQKVVLNVKSKSITSDNSIMNSKTEKALKANSYPEIDYKMVSLNGLNKTGDKYNGHLWGNLTIAGVTKYVKIDFNADVIENGNIKITGSKKINMTDFDVSPPTAMLGSLKTGDDITVSFDLYFVPDKKLSVY
jgi:polyisoprenoid-binding protein YceI